MSTFATVAQKSSYCKFYGQNSFSDRTFYATITEIDIESLKSLRTLFDKYLDPGVKIIKNCQGSFGPLMSYSLGPSQSLKGPDCLISLIGLTTVSQFCGPT